MNILPRTLRLLILSIFFTLFTAQSSFAELRARWIGVAGVVIEDGETTLVFDPTFSRPGLLNVLGLKPLVPEPAVVEENLQFLNLKKAAAVFVSHEHFDHALDAALVAHRLGASIYGGDSLRRIVHANERYFQWRALFRSVVDRDVLQVGKFKIHFYRRTHAAIFPAIGFHYLGGAVPENFDFGFYQYREGEVWCFRVEHPEGKIFVDQGSHFFEGAAGDLQGVDFVLAGVANKVSVEDFVEKYVGRLKPKILIPLHFDFFFTYSNREKTAFLPGTDLEEIQARSLRDYAKTRFILPKFGETIILTPAR